MVKLQIVCTKLNICHIQLYTLNDILHLFTSFISASLRKMGGKGWPHGLTIGDVIPTMTEKSLITNILQN